MWSWEALLIRPAGLNDQIRKFIYQNEKKKFHSLINNHKVGNGRWWYILRQAVSTILLILNFLFCLSFFYRRSCSFFFLRITDALALFLFILEHALFSFIHTAADVCYKPSVVGTTAYCGRGPTSVCYEPSSSLRAFVGRREREEVVLGLAAHDVVPARTSAGELSRSDWRDF